MIEMSVLVTGATGFVGSELVEQLVKKGHEVYVMLRHTSKRDLKPLESVLDQVRFIEADLTDYHSVRSAVESSHPQAVMHLGALTPVRLSFTDPFPFMQVNLLGTMNLVHAIIKYSPETKLIASSTAEVYGWQPETPTRETAPFHPSSPYGVSKAAMDQYLQMAMKVYKLKAVILRCNNTYGRIGESGFITEYLIKTMLEGKPVYLGAPDHVRDYMYVDDHVAAYLLALEHSGPDIFNVSPGNPVSNAELAERIKKLTCYTGNIVHSYPPGYPQRPAPLDTPYIVLDSSRIRNMLGWKPSVDLESGLHKTVEAWDVRMRR